MKENHRHFVCGFIDFYYKEGRLLCRLQMFGSAIAVYAVIFFMYFIVCWPLSILAGKLEKRQKDN